MKKFISMFFVVLMMASLVACGNQAVSEEASAYDDTHVKQETVENSNKPTINNEPVESIDTVDVPENITENEAERSSEDTEAAAEQEHEHKYTSKVVPQTCYEDGYTLHSCSCGDSYKDSTTPKLPHLYCEKVVPPTSTAQGYTKYTCIHCGDIYNSNNTPATGDSSSGDTGNSDSSGTTTTPSTSSHTCNYVVQSVVPGTCTAKGYTVYVCSCGDSYKDDYNGGKGHQWEDVYEDVEVYESVVVTRCGYCHANLDDVDGVAHIKWEALNNNVARSYQAVDQVYVGTEVQIVGSKCSVCGADY